MAFMGFVNVYALRVNLSVALIAMVNETDSKSLNSTDGQCPVTEVNSTSPFKKNGNFNWDENLQGLILGAFFYGYITTQIPGGWLANWMGGKVLFGGGIFITALLSIVIPICAKTSVSLLIAVRVVQGIGEGVTFPAMHAMWGRWAPPLERSRLVSFSYAGAQLGTVIALPISGYLCQSSLGWESVFYVFGGVGCVWCVAWMFIVSDSPAKHPRISREEKDYVETSIGVDKHKDLKTPWFSILTSMPFWAILMAHMCNNWGFYTLLTTLPKYMREILKFDIAQNGFLSAVPYLCMWIIGNVSGISADYLRHNKILSTTAVRKLYNGLGLMFPAVFLICVTIIKCNHILAVLFLSMAVGLEGMIYAGFNVNHLDIAPAYAGTLYGLTNLAATIPGFLGPQVVGILTDNNNTMCQWHKALYIASGIYAFGAIFYAIFGSGAEQRWAKKPLYQAKNLQDTLTNHDSTQLHRAGGGHVPPFSSLHRNNMTINGFLSAVPYLCMWIIGNVSGISADYLRHNKILSTTAVRKLYNGLGLMFPAVFLICVTIIKCNHVLAVLFLSMAVGLEGMIYAGFNVNHLDIAPAYAGTLLGFTNCAATIPGFLGPQVVGILTDENNTMVQWHKAFYISSAVYAFGAIFYVIFGSGVEQGWAKKPLNATKNVQESVTHYDSTHFQGVNSLHVPPYTSPHAKPMLHDD
ncbi:sialin [Lingula anatina]|uniref:Sialin n=1 Tax=Lingula anatina TaxID=7574 RepID=A0A1S3JKX4_LINAN|nr:sialin [Lingula anatina]|eukprot:XP_013411028.1 sialin [Lingula anatina]